MYVKSDTSHDFLHSSNPSNMFNLFMKGTLLEKNSSWLCSG